MTSREQTTFERLETLLDLLAEQGTIPTEWRDALGSIGSPEQGREARDRARRGDGPPPWAGRPPGRPGTSITVPPVQDESGDGSSG